MNNTYLSNTTLAPLDYMGAAIERNRSKATSGRYLTPAGQQALDDLRRQELHDGFKANQLLLLLAEELRLDLQAGNIANPNFRARLEQFLDPLLVIALELASASFDFLTRTLSNGEYCAYARPTEKTKTLLNDSMSLVHCSPLLAEKNTTITSNINIQDKEKFSADEGLLLQILQNIYTNATRAAADTANPKIHLDTWIENLQGSPRRLHVKTTNSGEISQKIIDNAGRIMQSTKIGEQDQYGYGLVSMVNKIRAHGGDAKQPLTIRKIPDPATSEPMVEVSFYIQEMDGYKLLYPPTGA